MHILPRAHCFFPEKKLRTLFMPDFFSSPPKTQWKRWCKTEQSDRVHRKTEGTEGRHKGGRNFDTAEMGKKGTVQATKKSGQLCKHSKRPDGFVW